MLLNSYAICAHPKYYHKNHTKLSSIYIYIYIYIYDGKVLLLGNQNEMEDKPLGVAKKTRDNH